MFNDSQANKPSRRLARKNRMTYKTTFRQYMNGKLKLETYQKVGIAFLIVVFAGLIGWIYEAIFYFFNYGMTGFYMQGGNFLPWMNIYAIGALIIILTTYKVRQKPWLVLLISMVTTGIVEYVGGWLVYNLFNGARYWDYNTEILNWGNIDGFVCFRSVLCFGLSALILMYVVLPFCIHLAKTMSRRAFLILSISLFSIVMTDELYNLLASHVFNWPNAVDFYKSLGLKYYGI